MLKYFVYPLYYQQEKADQGNDIALAAVQMLYRNDSELEQIDESVHIEPPSVFNQVTDYGLRKSLNKIEKAFIAGYPH